MTCADDWLWDDSNESFFIFRSELQSPPCCQKMRIYWNWCALNMCRIGPLSLVESNVHEFVRSPCIRTTSIPVYSARNLIHCQPRRRARKKRQNSFLLVASTGHGLQGGWLIIPCDFDFRHMKSHPFLSHSLSLSHPLRSIHQRDWRGNSEK